MSITVERGRMKDRNASGGVGGGGGIGGGGGGIIGGPGGRGGIRGGGRGFGGNRGGGGGCDRKDRMDGGIGGNMRGGFGGGGNFRGGIGGAGGPIRMNRDNRGGGNRGVPYNKEGRDMMNRREGGGRMRNGGGFDRGMDGSMNMMNSQGPMDRMGGGLGNNMMNDRFDGGGFGFSNQDRRGFALPERQMFPNDMGGRGGGGGGSFGGNPGMGGPPMGAGPGNIGGLLDRRSPPPLGGIDQGGGMGDMYNRRGGPM